MSDDRFLARLRVDPRYALSVPEDDPPASVRLVGYHASFATTPRPGTPIAAFDGVGDAVPFYPGLVMALVRIENAGASIRTEPDGTVRWDSDPFGIGMAEFGWYLTPVEHTGTGWVLAPGWWAAGGRQAVLPRSVLDLVPTARSVVAVHDHDPHTGHRWQPR